MMQIPRRRVRFFLTRDMIADVYEGCVKRRNGIPCASPYLAAGLARRSFLGMTGTVRKKSRRGLARRLLKLLLKRNVA